MRFVRSATTAVAVVATAAGLSAVAVADDGSGGGNIDTRADYSPFARFQPLDASTPCVGAVDDPFVIPPGYTQHVVAQEGDPGTTAGVNDNWDMNTQNERGTVDPGRYIYRAHEVGSGGSVTVTDLKTGETTQLAQRADWERLDPATWTPWGTLLIAEETNAQALPDPEVPQATAGLVYELFIDPDDPTKLDPSREDIAAEAANGVVNPVQDGIAPRPAVGSKSHEGMRFSTRGELYGISEVAGGSIFRFTPDDRGDLASGLLQAYKADGGDRGPGTWADLDRTAVQVNAQAEADSKAATGYNRPEDVETTTSTGRDVNNGGETAYVAVTGDTAGGPDNEVLAVDDARRDSPFVYQYVGSSQAGNATGEFQGPDNLALDRDGNLAITEDKGTVAPSGDDIWVAPPPRNPGGRDDRGFGTRRDHEPAGQVQRFASLKDCEAEPTGIYFAMGSTDRYTQGTPREGAVNDETLFVDRQHSGDSIPNDQLVAITPTREHGR